jgi:hypothetical protein
MKYLKRFNEAIIRPFDFKELLDIISSKNYTNISELNELTRQYNVIFSNFDDFYDSLGLEIEKILAPKELLLYGGVKFALYNKYKNIIMIVVEVDLFFNFIKNNDLSQFLSFLNEILRHESIHLQQVDRMKDKTSYKLDSSPTHNSDKYWKEKRELMAYAQTLIDHLVSQNLSKKEIEEKLKSHKDIRSWVFNIYKKLLNEKEMKRFMKYLYQYYEII